MLTEKQNLLFVEKLSVIVQGTVPLPFAPIEDAPTFHLLASTLSKWLHAQGLPVRLMIVDKHTVGHAVGTESVCREAAKVYLLGGNTTSRIAKEPHVTSVELSDGAEDDCRILVVITDTLVIGMVCAIQHVRNDDRIMVGGWTCQLPHILSLLSLFSETLNLEEDLCSYVADPQKSMGDAEDALTVSQLLSVSHAQHLTSRTKHIVQAKDDLSSVLQILKAISAKRRAHDILYIFVEQIARIISTDRCSVLRVWGGEREGHVLASHEDQTITNLVISLDKYPEVNHALITRSKVVISDAQNDPLTKAFSEELHQANITSLLVIPIVLFDTNVGSFLLRATRGGAPFSLREINFCEIVAEAAANALERAHLFESIQRANERLEYLAVTDGLTGLFNQRHFRDRLDQEFARSLRYTQPLSLLILDIDDFKKVNDTYGHLQGDTVLREIAARILGLVRNVDVVARYGGEEIVVIMPQTGREGALIEAERIRQVIVDEPYAGIPKGHLITASIGLACLQHETMTDAEELVKASDKALYEAKTTGKNRVVFADPEETD